MRMANRLRIGIKAAAQLGMRYTWLYACYKLKIRSGILRWLTPAAKTSTLRAAQSKLALPLFPPPSREGLTGVLGTKAGQVIAEAEEVCSGNVRLFGGKARHLELMPSGRLHHWTRHTGYQHDGVDIKFIWEPGRFGWAVVLARAYILNGSEKYAETFWRLTEEFIQGNPPNLGPHWASAQEVGLRLIALVFSAGVFKESPHSTAQRMALFAEALAAHAERIPPTLGYARAQNNNHLLSEAAALYTAAAVLPDHPKADRWRVLGRLWLQRGLDAQITEDGEYVQHSTNYHRLMLQLGLWVSMVALGQGEDLSESSKLKLAAATRWLFSLLDNTSGQVPNLGSNDGAYILPLAVGEFGDYRPVLQAAGRAFLGQELLPKGVWDEMSLWLAPKLSDPIEPQAAAPLRIRGKKSWAYLRAVEFRSRPSHADQLHVDLWWNGKNLALDGGTFQYNAAPPWRNALDPTCLHNTLTINGLEQMTKAGQFLWLDWAQAAVQETRYDKDGRLIQAAACHDGYRKIGAIHSRVVTCHGDRWQVSDQVAPVTVGAENKLYNIRLHWLLPDWEWVLEGSRLQLKSGVDEVVVQVTAPGCELSASLVRAGETLAGAEPAGPTRGWVSPTYGEKRPALSFAVWVETRLPFDIDTTWLLPEQAE